MDEGYLSPAGGSVNNLEGWGGCKGRREALEEGDIYKLMAHSCGFMAEINTGL